MINCFALIYIDFDVALLMFTVKFSLFLAIFAYTYIYSASHYSEPHT